ncbi:DUF397 domain-containing protein [Streptomyces sp. NPDC005302]|uniref:DUF397 domain-containing protein n=1 Tax=Streptomyces sp. NPDC005302 TaxID=3154675 RepID=UPI0033A78258
MTMITDSTSTGFHWTKSSYSGGDNNCVEVAHNAMTSAMPVRDSKVPAGPAVVFADTTWGVFVDALKSGDVA